MSVVEVVEVMAGEVGEIMGNRLRVGRLVIGNGQAEVG